MTNKTIIFDFDGTIADTIEIFITITKELADKYHFNDLKDAKIELFKTHSIVDIALHYCHIPWYKLPFVVYEFKQKLVQHSTHTKLFAGILEVLTELKKNGFRLGLLSSSPCKAISNVVSRYDLNQMFDFIQTDAPPFAKERILIKILKKYKLEKNDVFYIGDEVRDIKACHKIDLNCIAVSWGFSDKEILESHKPTVVIDRPVEIIEYLSKKASF